MTLAARVVNSTIKGLTSILCRVDDKQLTQIPERGPLILVANHINFLEIPVVYTRLTPRPIKGFAKAETWNNPVIGILFNLWGGIPIKRGEADTQALRRGLAALEAGQILAVAPEGTRSNNGCLQRGHPGIVVIALHSRAPILPMVYYGSEKFRRNLTQFRRTDFYINIGQPFYLDPGGNKVTRYTRRLMVDEIMYQMAALLPAEYRGDYANLEAATENFLRFPHPYRSNLLFTKEKQLKIKAPILLS